MHGTEITYRHKALLLFSDAQTTAVPNNMAFVCSSAGPT